MTTELPATRLAESAEYRAAVAELIEACKARDEAERRGENIEWSGVGKRYRAAVARLGGAA